MQLNIVWVHLFRPYKWKIKKLTNWRINCHLGTVVSPGTLHNGKWAEDGSLALCLFLSPGQTTQTPRNGFRVGGAWCNYLRKHPFFPMTSWANFLILTVESDKFCFSHYYLYRRITNKFKFRRSASIIKNYAVLSGVWRPLRATQRPCILCSS